MIEVVVLVRFSFLRRDDSGFRRTKGLTLEERSLALFDERRMTQRFALFETVCLPSLAAQPRARFGAIVLAAEAMPATHRARLERLLAPYPNLVVAYEPPGPIGEAFGRHIDRLGPLAEIIVTCRLDDDDALAPGFAERIATFRKDCYVDHCVSLYRGFSAARILGRPRVWRRNWVMGSVGLGLVSRSNSPENVFYCGDHKTVAERYPTILDGTADMFLYVVHGGNDSRRNIPLGVRLLPGRSHPLIKTRREHIEMFPCLGDDRFAALL